MARISQTKPAPIWQTRPCPPWCTSIHHDADGQGARECLSDFSSIGLTLMETLITRTTPKVEAALDTLNITIEQGEREFEPRVTFYRADGTGFDMTLDEAGQLVEHVTALIKTGRDGGVS